MQRLAEDVYITVNDCARRLQMAVKPCREFLIHGRRVKYIMVGRRFLIDKQSFLEWEARHTFNPLTRY